MTSANMAGTNAAAGAAGARDIDRMGLLKILFKKLLGDGRIDAAEKTLFAEFKREFGISDAQYSGALAETVAEIKAGGNVFEGPESLDENGREYKIAIYREAYYRMLLNGRISESENELLIGLNKILGLAEDAEGEAVLAAREMVVAEAEKNIARKNFRAAEGLLLAFQPDEKHCGAYYRAAYMLCKGKASEDPPAGASAKPPDVEFEELFMRRGGVRPACWEALYYRGRLAPVSADGRREKLLNEALEAAADDGQRHLSYFQLAFGRQAAGDYEKALEYYAEAEKYDGGDADTAVNRLSCLLSLKRYEQAEKYAAGRLEKFSSSAAFINNCGIARLRTGDREGAAGLFKKALAVDPEFSDARANLSKIK